MGRNGRTTITSGTGGAPKWTDEQRQVLMLCYQLWNLTDQEVNTLVHLVYPEFRNGGRRNYAYDHTRTEYVHRFKPGRSTRWRTIDRPNAPRPYRGPYTQAESNELHRVQRMIEAAAFAGSITLTPRANASFPQYVAMPASNQPATGTVAAADEENEEESEELEEQGDRSEPSDDLEQAAGDEVEEEGTEAADVEGTTSPTQMNLDSTHHEQTRVEQKEEGLMKMAVSKSSKRSRTREEDEEEEKPAEGTEPAHKRQKPSSGIPASKTDQRSADVPDADMTSPESATRSPTPEPYIKTVVIPQVNDPNQPSMTMVHVMDLRWDENIVSTHPNVSNKYGGPLVVANDSVHGHGGSVQYVKHYCSGEYEYKHVMVCDENICRTCNPNAREAEIENAKGRPFVHRGEGRDVETFDDERSVYILKKVKSILQKNELHPYDNERHEYFELGLIQYEDNGSKKVRSAYICDPEECPSCKSNPNGFNNEKVYHEMRELQQKKFKGPKFFGE